MNDTAPHDPWINAHPDEYLAHYEGCDFPSVPRETPHPWVEPRKDDFAEAFADPEPHLAGYCASLTAVDDGLGRILAALREQGLSDSTVVVFMSDNGFSCGQHGIWGKGNGTFPRNMWDNSVRVPCVVRVPDGARGVSKALVPATALHPTLCELAGVEAPADQWAVAGSVADLLRGDSTEGHEIVVVATEYGGARMITDGRWKFVHRHDGPDELYDLETDPQERKNLVDESAQSDRVASMRAQLNDWFAAHERAEFSAFDRGVTGFGQINAVNRGLPEDEVYVGGSMTFDGVRNG